jgi:hypothetical protein
VLDHPGPHQALVRGEHVQLVRAGERHDGDRRRGDRPPAPVDQAQHHGGERRQEREHVALLAEVDERRHDEPGYDPDRQDADLPVGPPPTEPPPTGLRAHAADRHRERHQRRQQQHGHGEERVDAADADVREPGVGGRAVQDRRPLRGLVPEVAVGAQDRLQAAPLLEDLGDGPQ